MNQPPQRIPSVQPVGRNVAATPVSQDIDWNDPAQRNPAITLGVLTVLLSFAYGNMFALTSSVWDDPLYSFCWIVPIFSLFLLWTRRQPFRPVPLFERWIGLAFLAAAMSTRVVAAYYDMAPLDRLSYLVALFGVFLLVGGWELIKWSWPALGISIFMFPLPSILEHTLLWNLQKLATIGSTWVLQMLGVAAFRSGNVIHIASLEEPLFVADACSGLRMLTVFCFFAVAMIFMIDRPWWDKFIILLSAIPIALAVNIIRITTTGALYMIVGQDNHFAQKLGHDWAGYFMMPLALGFLWLELQILNHLTVPVEATQLRPVGGRGAGVAGMR
jgi:exosortase